MAVVKTLLLRWRHWNKPVESGSDRGSTVELVTLEPEHESAPEVDQPLEENRAQNNSNENHGNQENSSREARKRWMYRNIFGLAFSYLLVFSAFRSLQTLQSSLHPEGGLGLASLSIVYSGYILSSFVTPGIVRTLGTKNTILIAYLSHLLYVVVNFYPSWYTLVPGSLILGLGAGPVWAAGNAHTVKVCVISASELGKDQNLLISKLVGYFFLIFQLSYLPGNLAASLIFFPYSTASNDSDSHGNFSIDSKCEITEHRTLDKIYLYILVSVYVFIISMGIIILCTLVSRLQAERERNIGIKRSFVIYFLNPIIGMLKMFKNYRTILYIPLVFTGGLELSFLYGTFTQIVITGCFGVYLVGFAVVVFGLVSAVTSAIFGRIVKWIPRFSLYLLGGSINICLLIFLVLWRLSPSFVAVFLFIALWGVTDAVWLSLTSSLIGILFPKESELAYSVQRVWMAAGLAAGFVCAQLMPLRGRCYVLIIAVAMALVSNLILEFKTQPREQLLPWFLRRKKYSVVITEEKEEDKLPPEN